MEYMGKTAKKFMELNFDCNILTHCYIVTRVYTTAGRANNTELLPLVSNLKAESTQNIILGCVW